MFDAEEEPKDWEVKDEEPPESLQRKWDREAAQGPRIVLCPGCHKESSSENLPCLFCGTTLPLTRDRGTGFLVWIKKFLGGKLRAF